MVDDTNVDDQDNIPDEQTNTDDDHDHGNQDTDSSSESDDKNGQRAYNKVTEDLSEAKSEQNSLKVSSPEKTPVPAPRKRRLPRLCYDKNLKIPVCKVATTRLEGAGRLSEGPCNGRSL